MIASVKAVTGLDQLKARLARAFENAISVGGVAPGRSLRRPDPG